VDRAPWNPLLTLIGAAYPLSLFYGMHRPFRPYHPTVSDAFLLALPVLLFGLMTYRAARTGVALGRLRRWYGLFGAIYIGLSLGSFVLLRSLQPRIRVGPFGPEDRGAWLMLLVSVCVWATDTAAYFVGRGVGRRKLAPTLSPGKTVEGALGGLVGGLVAGGLFGAWLRLTPYDALTLGALAAVAGQIGDLWESALKRELGIKDFGAIMPGHGGALDRFDSLLFVAPLAYLYLLWRGAA
jgi:phosphatidate cytidylyltransferase